MDDLVKRLRRMDGDSMSIKTLDEAADRIEALDARIARADALADALEAWQTDMFAMRLSHALKVGATLVVYREGSDT